MKYTGKKDSKGKRHGQGTLTYADGRRYRGKWKDGKLNGPGTVTYTNGDGATYTGEFKAGRPAP